MGHGQRFLRPFPWRNNLWETRLYGPEYVTLIDNIPNVLINYTSTHKASIKALIWIHSTACKWLSQWKDGLPSNIMLRFLHHMQKIRSSCWCVLHGSVHLPAPLFSVHQSYILSNRLYNWIHLKRGVRRSSGSKPYITCLKYVVVY